MLKYIEISSVAFDRYLCFLFIITASTWVNKKNIYILINLFKKIVIKEITVTFKKVLNYILKISLIFRWIMT